MQNVKVYIKFESNENIQNYHYLNVITLESVLIQLMLYYHLLKISY